MRIWSLHPKYLDTKGLVALWRETLLAKNVLEGKTSGYRNHPQLRRFKMAREPLKALNYYLHHVWIEANTRSFSFDENKFTSVESVEIIYVTTKQLCFERKHLLNKLKLRDEKKHAEISVIHCFETHPLFKPIIGDIEPWENT